MEIEPELNQYLSIIDRNVSELFRRYSRDYYSARYVKRRINAHVYNAIKTEFKKIEEGVSPSHAGYAYPSVDDVLRDMHDYKKYMERNKNEDKNEDIPTGIQ